MKPTLKNSGLMAAMLVVLTAGCAAAMPAPAVTAYACTPDAFTLQQVDGGLRLVGSLEVPTPGYSATFNAETAGISLLPPQGMALQVITALPIDMLLPASVADTTGRVELELEKPYAWGPDTISCQPVVSTPATP